MTGDQLYHVFLWAMAAFWCVAPLLYRKKLHCIELRRLQLSVDLVTEQNRLALARWPD